MLKMTSTAKWFAAVLLSIAGSASAAPIGPSFDDLQDLIDLGSQGVVIGDKQFYDFTYKGTYSGGNPAPTAAQIAVSTAPGSNVGLEFSFGWNASGGSMMDSLIGYKIKVLDPNLTIDKVGLLFNGFATYPSNANVVETVQDISGTFLGQLAVYTDPDGPGSAYTQKVSDGLDLVPNQRELIIRKDIMVFSPSGGGFASISLVDNTYPQVPEPAMVGWVLAGAPLLLVRRRR